MLKLAKPVERPINVPKKPSETRMPGIASAKTERPGSSITVSSLI